MLPGERRIAIEVVTADALWFDVDVLVLKHAQVSLGVDAEAKRRLGLDLEMDLAPGRELVLDGPPALGARKVVFLGAPPVEEFGYAEIRLFARRAMSLVKAELPDTKELGLTLHGAGFGLDEIACFNAELAGLGDAINSDAVPPGLERVLILESNERRAERLREHMAEFSDGRQTRGFAVPVGTATRGTTVEDLAPIPSDHAFVAMPFSTEFEDVFNYGIAPPVRASGLLCERIDQAVFTGSILDRMKERIRSARLVVADLTDANANVYLEVGFAWAAAVPTVLVHRADSDPKFDVQSERCLSYGNITELEKRLTEELGELVRR
jgi:hypothetical protein